MEKNNTDRDVNDLLQRMPCSIQYCYAHLLRDVKDLEKDFPENAEVKAFVEALAPKLANAIP